MTKTARLNESASRLAACPEWLAGERSHEIARLEAVVRSSEATADEVKVAKDQLKHWGAE
ncbi:MAG: hypothetical protein WB716_08585 [Candidatus Acidiferrales bacterium]